LEALFDSLGEKKFFGFFRAGLDPLPRDTNRSEDAMKTNILKLEEIEARITELDRKILQLKEERDRRLMERTSTRRRMAVDRKIICGGIVLDLAAREEAFRKVLTNILNRHLQDPVARRIFGDLLGNPTNDNNLPGQAEEPKPSTGEDDHG
jgi:chorismate mutase